MFTYLRGILVALLSSACVSQALAANITELKWKDGRTRITIEGEILPGDSDKFKALIKTINDSGRSVHGVRLNSPGGNLAEGVAIADTVRFAKVLTIVPPSAQCASACFIVFAAGNEKFASYSAFVGVHGASDSSGRETVQSGAATLSMARIVKDLGVPAAIIGKMVVTPPEKIIWLSPDDLRSMSVNMTGKPDQLQPMPELNSQLPMQIAPQTQASAPATWSKIVQTAIETSSSQNNGRPLTARNCQPEFKVCNNAIFVNGKDGKTLMVRTEEDLTGKIIRREFCEVNRFGDVRICTNWDTNAVHRDMKDSKGVWSKIADE